MNRIEGKNHVGTYEINKISLSFFDDNGIDALALAA